jgi:hypothetical protein
MDNDHLLSRSESFGRVEALGSTRCGTAQAAARLHRRPAAMESGFDPRPVTTPVPRAGSDRSPLLGPALIRASCLFSGSGPLLPARWCPVLRASSSRHQSLCCASQKCGRCHLTQAHQCLVKADPGQPPSLTACDRLVGGPLRVGLEETRRDSEPAP